jgi:hypothetical protein
MTLFSSLCPDQRHHVRRAGGIPTTTVTIVGLPLSTMITTIVGRVGRQL